MQSDGSSHEQLQIYTNWANYYLRKKGHAASVRDLQTDLQTGVLLSKIIEAVFEFPVPGIWLSPATEAQELENLSCCLDFIRDRGLELDDVTNSDIHQGSLDAVFSLFYALSVHRQKIKASTARPQTSTPLHPGDRHTSIKSQAGVRSATPPSVPPKQKKHSSNSNLDKPDTLRSFGYKEGVRKQSLDETGSAPVSRGGSLDRRSLREEFRLSGRGGQSFSEEQQGRRRYGLGGSVSPQQEVKKSASWLSVREASRLSEGRKASKNLSVKELVNFLEKGEIPPEENEGKKLPSLPPKPRPGRLEAKQEEAPYSFQPIEPVESGRVALRHSYASDPDSAPPSSSLKVDVFSQKFLPSNPVSHEYSSAGTPPPEDGSGTANTFPSLRGRAPAERETRRDECPPLPPRNPSTQPGAAFLSRRGESFLSEDRFTMISLLTENEQPPDQTGRVQTIVASLGPSQVETCLVNSDRLPSPKMTQTVSLSPGTGTTGSEFSSPELTQSLESPFVRGVSARSEERVDRSGRGKGGLVGWASKSFRRMSTPKQSSKKRLPLPESPNSAEIRPHALKRASSEWNNRFPARDRTHSPARADPEPHKPSLPRSVSLSESFEPRQRPAELGPASSEYRPALPARRPPGEKPLSQEIQELLAGFDISLESRPRGGESPTNLYANLGTSESPADGEQLRGVTPVTLDTVSIPPTVVSEGVHAEGLSMRQRLDEAEAKRDLIYKQLLFAQDQLARRDEELRELRERLEHFERKFEDSSLAVHGNGVQGDGQTGEKKKRVKRRWLLRKSRAKNGDASESESGSSIRGRDTESIDTPRKQGDRYQSELQGLLKDVSSLREENAQLKRELQNRESKETPLVSHLSPQCKIQTTSPVSISPLFRISIFVLTRDHHDMRQERLIGVGRVELSGSEVSWESLDREVQAAFSAHLRYLDPQSLGIEEAVGAYLIGSVRRQVGARQIGVGTPLDVLQAMSRPEITVDLRALSLSHLSYQLLVPLRVLQQYVEILMRQRRILVMGPPGTGKSHLAQSLGQYVALVTAPRASRSAYTFLSAEKFSLSEIRHSLSATLKLETAKGKVFVFDGLSSAQDLNEICSPLLFEKSDPPSPDSPYILATLRSEFSSGLKPVLLQHGLWVVSYLWHREPVLGMLGRLLKQKFRHFQVSPSDGYTPSPLTAQMVEWLPTSIDRLNTFIESAYSPAAVFGPGIFLSCPLGNSPSLIEKWFSQIWSEYLSPVLREITSHNLQDVPNLSEMAQQILKGCPVKVPSLSDIGGSVRTVEPRNRQNNGHPPSVIESEL